MVYTCYRHLNIGQHGAWGQTSFKGVTMFVGALTGCSTRVELGQPPVSVAAVQFINRHNTSPFCLPTPGDGRRLMYPFVPEIDCTCGRRGGYKWQILTWRRATRGARGLLLWSFWARSSEAGKMHEHAATVVCVN